MTLPQITFCHAKYRLSHGKTWLFSLQKNTSDLKYLVLKFIESRCFILKNSQSPYYREQQCQYEHKDYNVYVVTVISGDGVL